MKSATVFHKAFRLLIIFFFVFCTTLSPEQAQAQNSDYQENTNLESSEKFSREELAQMLAPVALYPDRLLSQIFMASTYPLEVIEADRWLKKNPNLKDEALHTALLDKDWDPSIKAICHLPSILTLMSERITKFTNIGNAFLVQEAEVMGMVQELRSKARAQGNLTSNSQQNVVVEKETIIIEPANPRVMYVPYYDPFSIYGPWWYPSYPPYYWGPPGVIIGTGISYWPRFSFGFAFGSWSYFDWHRHHIYVDGHKRPRFVRHNRWRTKPGRWDHHPRHRRGVAYRDKSTARKYGQSPRRSRNFRRDTRGFPEHRKRSLDRDRDHRSRIDRSRSRVDRTKIKRERQERKRVERDRQKRERVERDRQQRRVIDRERPQQKRVERDRQQRQRLDRGKQQQKHVERDLKTRKRVKREWQQKSRKNVFKQVEDGKRERKSSERGRVSRQGRGFDSSSKSRSGSKFRRKGRWNRGNRGSRSDRGSNRR